MIFFVFVYVWYSLVSSKVISKVKKQYFLFLHTPYVTWKWKRNQWSETTRDTWKNPTAGLFSLLIAWLPFRVEYLRTQSMRFPCVRGFRYCELPSLQQSAVHAARASSLTRSGIFRSLPKASDIRASMVKFTMLANIHCNFSLSKKFPKTTEFSAS